MIDIFPSENLPAHLKCQILSFIRIEWSWVFEGSRAFWDYTQKPTHPVNVVLHEQQTVISHAEINWRMITHQGIDYRCYGLSAVFTYPSFREQGYGTQVVAAATRYLQQQPEADLAMLFCEDRLLPFYAAHGWKPMPQVEIAYGDAAAPTLEAITPIMLFLSPKASAAASAFESEPLYVGATMW